MCKLADFLHSHPSTRVSANCSDVKHWIIIEVLTADILKQVQIMTLIFASFKVASSGILHVGSRAQLNGTEPSLMSLVTPVLLLLQEATMFAVHHVSCNCLTRMPFTLLNESISSICCVQVLVTWPTKNLNPTSNIAIFSHL